jgi:hypothetical protein
MNPSAPARPKTKLPIYLGIGAGLVVFLIGVAWFFVRPAITFNFDATSAPNFVTADFVDLNNYSAVSKFRSGAGQDFSSGGETCRSMKHIFLPRDTSGQITEASKFPASIDPDTSVSVYSPVTGTINSIEAEPGKLGRQIYIKPDGQDAFTVRLFNVFPLDGIAAGSKITAGDRIGSVLPWQQTSVAVQVVTLGGQQLISYFDVADDNVMANYMDLGAGGTEDLIISREYRDTHPLECEGAEFKEKDNLTGDHWLFLGDFTPAS